MEYQNHTYSNVLPSYLDNPLLKPRNFYETGMEKSLENIVLRDEQEVPRSIVDRVFSDKSRTLKATIKALFNDLLTRERLDAGMLSKIDSEICKTDSYLEQIREVTKRQYGHDLELAFSGRRTQLESRVLDLEKEKRQEYLACWKDLAYLSKGMLSALKDYWNLSNRKSFLNLENDQYRESV